jgi:hypothetical protein
MNESDIVGTCSTHVGYEKLVQHFGRENFNGRRRLGGLDVDVIMILNVTYRYKV